MKVKQYVKPMQWSTESTRHSCRGAKGRANQMGAVAVGLVGSGARERERHVELCVLQQRPPYRVHLQR